MSVENQVATQEIVNPEGGSTPPADIQGKAATPTTAEAEANRRAAAIAALGDDFGKEESGDGVPAGDDAGGAGNAAAAEAAKEPAKEEPRPLAALSPELAAAAKADKRLQEQSQALKREREEFQAERVKWEQERAKTTGSVEQERREFLSDPVAYADKHKLTPQQRYELGTALAWSSQPEEKRPANWRGTGQSRVLSEVETVKAEAARVAKELADYKAEAQREREQQKEQELANQVADEVITALPESAKLVRAFVETHPKKARQDMWVVANQLREELLAEIEEGKPGRPLTPALVAERYEQILDEQSAWFRKVAPVPATHAAVKPGAPKSIPQSATASPTRPVTKPANPMSEEARRQRKAEAEAAIQWDD